MTVGLVIRGAEPSEAAVLADLMSRTFRDAFGADNRPEDLARYLAASYGEAIQAAELRDPRITTLLALLHGVPVGYAQVRRGSYLPACVTSPEPVELWRFYLEQAWIGRGLARPLMEAVESVASARGRTLWLGVWERNARAIRFYRKVGFVEVGSHVFHVGGDPQTDLIMVRSLRDGTG